MVLYIYPNIDNPAFAEKARAVAAHFAALGVKCACPAECASLLCPAGAEDTLASEQCDYVCSVGGDGTMLHAAAVAFNADKPFFGINAGRVGYLSAFDFNELEKITPDSVLALTPSHRTLLKVTTAKGCYYALNDAVLSKADPARTVQLSVFCGTSAVAQWKADGVIAATPTGSTAYAFSAGGPVISPQLDVIEVAPVCPHSFFNRSVVFGGDKVLTFTLLDCPLNSVVLSIDGVAVETIESGTVTVSRAKRKLTLLQSCRHDFFSRYHSINFEREPLDESQKTTDDN